MGGILQVDTIQNNNTSNLITQTNVTTITIGASGQNIVLPSGTTGLLSMQSVQTTSFTASAGKAYPINTTSAAITVTLPATPSVGDQIQIFDYAGTADTNGITINPNGKKIQGSTDNLGIFSEREGVTLTYIDSTQGWLAVSGVNDGTQALAPLTYSVEFLVVAGGAGGGGSGSAGGGGGGGAGGFRTSTQTVTKGNTITVTVGNGGAGGTTSAGPNGARGGSGSNSSISGTGLATITSAGGGGGGGYNQGPVGGNGGSGGGGSVNSGGGSGNTPSTSPSQGNSGGAASAGNPYSAGGGGGSSGTGAAGSGSNGGAGGNGTASSITGSSITYAGGGGGGGGTGGPDGANGTGGGGTANRGGGNVGGTGSQTQAGDAGGSGVVILSMLTTKYSGTTTGSPTVTTSGSNTIIQFNGDGTYVA